MSKVFQFIVLLAIFSPIEQLIACSGWGHVDSDKSGNVILAKNRDQTAAPQSVELVKSESGYSYIGLFLKNHNGSLATKAGVNEKGLVMTSLSESTLLKHPKVCPGDHSAPNIIKNVLLNYGSVEDVKNNAESFFSNAAPAFYMLADKEQIIYVEIAPKPQGICNTSGATANDYSITTQDPKTGYIMHTNHYNVSGKFSQYNEKPYPSTYSRLDMLKTLLNNDKNANTIDQYLAYAHDQTNGPNNSLFRYNVGKHLEQTLATWIVQIPRDGSAPILDITLYQDVEVSNNIARIKDLIHQQVILTPDVFNSFEPLLGHAETCDIREKDEL
jgi:hypothetical protein